MIPGLLANFRTRCLVRGARRLSLHGPYAWRFVTVLATAPGGLERAALIDAVWGDRVDGGPEDPGGILARYVHRYTVPLTHLGLAVEPRKTRPWEMRDLWTRAERVHHLTVAADQAARVAAQASARHRLFAGMVAHELARLSA